MRDGNTQNDKLNISKHTQNLIDQNFLVNVISIGYCPTQLTVFYSIITPTTAHI